MEIGQKVKIEFNHPSLQSDAIGEIYSVYDTFVVVAYPENFVYEDVDGKFKEKKDYPKWLSNPDAEVKKQVWLPYVSFVGINKNKVVICQ